jgi:spermidine/putrescine-binding protein
MFKKKIKGRISLILVAMLMATAGCGKKGKNSKKVEDNKEANVVTESQFTGEDIEIPTTESASSDDPSKIQAVSYADKKNDEIEK